MSCCRCRVNSKERKMKKIPPLSRPLRCEIMFHFPPLFSCVRLLAVVGNWASGRSTLCMRRRRCVFFPYFSSIDAEWDV